MLPDVFSRRSTPARTGAVAFLALLLALTGCAWVPPGPAPSAPALTTPQAPTAPDRVPPAGGEALRPPASSPVGERTRTASDTQALAPTDTAQPIRPIELVDPKDARALATLLSYAERLRSLGQAEVMAEIAALGEPGSQPLGQMQLALALAHTHQPADTARALVLLQRVAAMESGTGGPYKALARLLAGRLLDQRRLEDALERQTQQVREQQRRIEQLTERLEAMRAIERSLNRPGSPSGNRNRTAPTP